MREGADVLIGRGKAIHEMRQWLRFGLPVAKGTCDNPRGLSLILESGEEVDAQFEPVTRWHDGSIQWVQVDAIGKLSGPLYLNAERGSRESKEEKDACSSAEEHFGQGQFSVSFGRGLTAELRLEVEGRYRDFTVKQRLEEHKHLSSEYEWLLSVDGLSDLEVSFRVTDVPGADHIEFKPQVHNLRASIHPNGCWDLGDPNSVYIDDFSLKIVNRRNPDTKLELRDESSNPSSGGSYSEGILVQYGSGGKNWNSPVHVDKHGRSTVEKRGFTLFGRLSEPLAEGLRAQPVVSFNDYGDLRYLVPHQFWENFPSSLEVAQGEVVWHLFTLGVELQPGEAKTWRCDVGCTASPANFIYDPAYIDATGVMVGCKLSVTNELTDLLNENLSGDGSFYQKRETSDEYGWRNFGELYADHEVSNVENEGIFVSHYNNQYDPVWGFSVQFLSTGDERWNELASDLARHVIDIDIYKTEFDKAEYNNGLFWHTDHYLPALTATHRTYSRNHEYAYEGHQGGGGPGGQHCYSSGLALRYFLTGNNAFKQAVIGLSDWIRCFYNGSPTVLGRLHRLLTVDLNSGKLTNVGYIDDGYKYPLDRGTGNYLNALIDAFLVGGDARLLDEMHSVIIQTLSFDDDVAARDLGNVEERWFYIVFLQSLARYLLLKEQLDQADQEYAYARHTFIHYIDWVFENEKIYLSNPEALEFPTDTWVAQDIRKANVLYYGAYFNPVKRKQLISRAHEFWDYCVQTLGKSPERHTTRIQAIVAQNIGVREWCLDRPSSPYPLLSRENALTRRQGIGARFLNDVARILRSFSISNEVAWLKGRLGGR